MLNSSKPQLAIPSLRGRGRSDRKRCSERTVGRNAVRAKCNSSHYGTALKIISYVIGGRGISDGKGTSVESQVRSQTFDHLSHDLASPDNLTHSKKHSASGCFTTVFSKEVVVPKNFRLSKLIRN